MKNNRSNSLYAAWEVYPTCNLGCSGCYALYEDNRNNYTLNNTKDVFTTNYLSLDKIAVGLANLKKLGVKYFNIEGGEPTLRKDIIEIVSLAKKHDMHTILSTHGMFLLNRNNDNLLLAEELRNSLDVLSVSLDSPERNINDSIRTLKQGNKQSGHFQSVINFLKWYKQAFENKSIDKKRLYDLKINVLVTKKNIDSLGNIVQFLKQYLSQEMTVQLKIIQIQPRGKALSNKSDLAISDKRFNVLAKKIINDSGNYFNVKIRYFNNNIDPIILIGFNGRVAIPRGETHEKIMIKEEQANVLFDDFVDSINQYVKKNPAFISKKKFNTYK